MSNWLGLGMAALAVSALGVLGGCGGDDGNDGNDNARATACAQTPSLAYCDGAAAPAWELSDVQPKSARFEERYGLAAYQDKVVLVAVLSAWCPYCQAQSVELEKLAGELKAAGAEDVQLVILNTTDGKEDLAQLTERTALPIFQDEPSVSAAQQHRASKDDLIVYGKDGKLLRFYPAGSARDLRDAGNFAAIKQALLDAR